MSKRDSPLIADRLAVRVSCVVLVAATPLEPCGD